MSPISIVTLPLGFLEWIPAVQALTLGLLTFVQEDLPTVSGALLASAGQIPWHVAWLGCFFGIWVGDALLYGIARVLGRPVLELPWARRFFSPAAVLRSEQWFAARGDWLLLSSRFVPGTRLPTYLAAGFLRLSFSRFLAITGIAVGIWTGGIFLLASWLGADLVGLLRGWSSGGWSIVAAVVAFMLILRFGVKVLQPDGRRRFAASLARWTHWEFWPAWLFYLPVGLNYLRLVLKYRGATLPTAANPGIFSGGIVGESKMATLRDLQATSPEFTAEAHLLEGTTPSERIESLHQICAQRTIELPFILKPDVGQRGVGVKLIRTDLQAESYIQTCRAPLLVQRYAPGPREVGVFYYRFPHETRGRIFAITEKVFPVLSGDGISTVEELIWRDPRARLVASTYLARFGVRKSEIPEAGAEVRLVEAGNHAQGCIFKDGTTALRSEALESRIDEISQRLTGFFIGRYDIRYESDDDLRTGKCFQILELNGAASEATSIYDSKNSLFSAYRTLFQQWELVFAIGAANRDRGWRATSLVGLWKAWRETAALIASYPIAD